MNKLKKEENKNRFKNNSAQAHSKMATTLSHIIGISGELVIACG
jgi:hypothetical protein